MTDPINPTEQNPAQRIIDLITLRGHDIQMQPVREYSETDTVKIGLHEGRAVIIATCDGGHDATQVDLMDVIDWVKINAPELI